MEESVQDAAAPLSIQTRANVPGEAAQEGPCAQTLALMQEIGRSFRLLASTCPTQATETIWEANY